MKCQFKKLCGWWLLSLEGSIERQENLRDQRKRKELLALESGRYVCQPQVLQPAARVQFFFITKNLWFFTPIWDVTWELPEGYISIFYYSLRSPCVDLATLLLYSSFWSTYFHYSFLLSTSFSLNFQTKPSQWECRTEDSQAFYRKGSWQLMPSDELGPVYLLSVGSPAA